MADPDDQPPLETNGVRSMEADSSASASAPTATTATATHTPTPRQPKRRRLELDSLKFSSPGLAFSSSDVEEGGSGRGARRSASGSASASTSASTSRDVPLRRVASTSVKTASTSRPSTRKMRKSDAGPSQAQPQSTLSTLQADLDATHSTHDSMVRELFHLAKFVTYVGYDPEAAKEDKSHVFEQFRFQHGFDLEQVAGEGSSGAGRVRSTRRNVSQRMEGLALRKGGEDKDSKGDTKGKGKQVDSGRPLDSGTSRKGKGREITPAQPKRPYKKRQSINVNAEDADSSDAAPESFSSWLRRRRAMDSRPLPSSPPSLLPLHPSHVPTPRRFASLADYYSSHHLLNSADHTDTELSSAEVQRMEKRELAAYLRVDEAKRLGTLPTEPGHSSSTSALRPPREPWRSSIPNTPHSALLQGITSHSHAMRTESRTRRSNARRISRMITTYWQSKSGSSERDRKALERHVRSLAKWTSREVAKQWKLAVSVVKARKQKEDQTRRERQGREQLSRILEQSTKYLGQRQEELERGGQESEEDSEADTGTESDVYSVEDDGSRSASEQEEDESGAEDHDDHFMDAVDADTPADTPADTTILDHGDGDGEHTMDSGTPADTSHLSTLMNVNGNRTQGRLAIGSDDEDEDDADDGDDERHRLLTRLLVDESENHSEISASSPGTSTSKRDRDAERKVNGVEDSGEDSDDFRVNGVGDSGEDSDDLSDATASDRDAEDARLEEELRRGDDSDSDEDEDAGLLEDAELDIEELRRRYGVREGADEEQGSHVDAGDDSASALADAPADGYTSSRASSRASSASPSAPTRTMPPPFLLRGNLRPYQQTGFEWLASLYANNANGILADEMGLGKTIQTISVLAHLACDKGVWGPHLVIAPTSVMLNWEVEFKKFLPGFKVLSYYGSQRERKEKRKGWNSPHSFNVCITSYQLVLADQHIFRRKPWIYMILDEAHHIKNFRSQRWQTLLGFNSQRRLLLTGTPLQNNLMDLWSLMYFLMPNGLADVPGAGAFANIKDFQDWFSNPLDKAVESGSSTAMDDETRKMVGKLHTILRPFLLRRLKSEVEKELPRKYEHVIRCRLSKRQRFLYNDFMSRAKTRESLASGNYMSIINCLMQLRKVCNHPDLFEVRPIKTAFAMHESVVGGFEREERVVRRSLADSGHDAREGHVMRSLRNVTGHEDLTPMATILARRLDATQELPHARTPTPPAHTPALDMWTIEGHRRALEQRRSVEDVRNWKARGRANALRIASQQPLYGSTLIEELRGAGQAHREALLPLDVLEDSHAPRTWSQSTANHSLVKSYTQRAEDLSSTVDRFAFVTPAAMALDMPRWAMDSSGDGPATSLLTSAGLNTGLTSSLQRSATKLQIAFPDASLLQYDCGKLQELALLMRRLKEGSHRILIFTQMTKVLDILESFLNLHGYRYLRLDGSTRIDRRQALTEKFNRDTRIDAFILSTRSGGLGINLTGADTVLFYDLDWNSAIESQCMDRAHRIGQLRDVHIYRFVSIATVEENMLKKADQKRLLDSMVIQGGEFTTEHLKRGGWRDMLDEGGTSLAGVQVGEGQDGEEEQLEAVEDEEDRVAATTARREMIELGQEEQGEFAGGAEEKLGGAGGVTVEQTPAQAQEDVEHADAEEDDDEGTVDDYMLRWVDEDWAYFNGGGFRG